jgi:hypothetical protein
MRHELRPRIEQFFSRFKKKDGKTPDEPLKIDLKSSPELANKLQERHLTDEERYRVVLKFYLEKSRYKIKENVIWGESPFLYDKKTEEVAKDESGKPIKFHLSWTPKLKDNGEISPQKEPSMLKFLEEKYKEERLPKKEKVTPFKPQLTSEIFKPKNSSEIIDGLTQEAKDMLKKIDKEGMLWLIPGDLLRVLNENGIPNVDIYGKTLSELTDTLRNKAIEKPANAFAAREQEKKTPGVEVTVSELLATKETYENAHAATIQAFVPYRDLLEKDVNYNSAQEALFTKLKLLNEAIQKSGMEEEVFKKTEEGKKIFEEFIKSFKAERRAVEAFETSTQGKELYDKYVEMKNIENKAKEELSEKRKLIPVLSS